MLLLKFQQTLILSNTEVDKESGALFDVCCQLQCSACNYGYINNTLSLDGDPVDVLVPTPYPLQPGSVIRCRPVGVLKMTDESVKTRNWLQFHTQN